MHVWRIVGRRVTVAVAVAVAMLASVLTEPALAQGTAVAAPDAAARGLILPRAARGPLAPCGPGLLLGVAVAPERVTGARLLAADLEVRGRTGGRSHMDADAVYHITSGWGLLIAGRDTARLGPGTVAYVPPGQRHVLATVSAAPLRGTLVLRPHEGAAALAGRAAFGCDARRVAGAREASTGASTGASTRAGTNEPATDRTGSTPAGTSSAVTGSRVLVLQATEGERIPYCVFPLTITAQVDSDAAPGARLTAATATLRRGAEAATHRGDDELVVVTYGRGRAFVGADTMAVEPGTVVFAPRGVRHGFMHDEAGTLEYFVVFSEPGPRELFRRFAARPGPYCPASTAPSP